MSKRAIKQGPEALVNKHRNLVHSDHQKVTSHVQREQDDGWVLHTLMIDGCDVPFRFRRQQRYQGLAGARVNLTYYAGTETVAGIAMEVMNVVRIKRS